MTKDFSADVWLGVGIGFAQETDWDTVSLILDRLCGLTVRLVLRSGEVLTAPDGSECARIEDLRVHAGDDDAPEGADDCWGGLRVVVLDEHGERYPGYGVRVIGWEEVARVEIY